MKDDNEEVLLVYINNLKGILIEDYAGRFQLPVIAIMRSLTSETYF